MTHDRWVCRDYILGALSAKHPITERAIKASVPEVFQKDIQPALAALVEAGLIMQCGKKYKRERTTE